MPQTKTKRRKPATKRRPGTKKRADRAAEARSWRDLAEDQRRCYLKNPLPYTIHDAYLCPNSRAKQEPRPQFPDDWSARELRVAEAALQGHLRLALACPPGYVAQISALVARTIRGVPKLCCAYDEINGQIIVWNMSEEDDDDYDNPS